MWAEPCLLPTATSKLSGAVERWLSAAERLYGPYMWGRYVLGPLAARGSGGQGPALPRSEQAAGSLARPEGGGVLVPRPQPAHGPPAPPPGQVRHRLPAPVLPHRGHGEPLPHLHHLLHPGE